jgi:hypothetical protein
MSLFWLSFVDPDRAPGSRFLGGSFVEIDDREGEEHRDLLRRALQRAHVVGCNPGGAVKAHVVPEDRARRIGPEWRHRVLSRSEIDALDQELLRAN